MMGGCIAGTPEPSSAPADFVGMRWSAREVDLTEELGEVELLDVYVDLPDVAIHVPSMVCGGTDGGSFDDPVSAAAIFRAAFPDQVIGDWQILGDEVFAIVDWDREVPTGGPGTMRSLGYAELRHIPR